MADGSEIAHHSGVDLAWSPLDFFAFFVVECHLGVEKGIKNILLFHNLLFCIDSQLFRICGMLGPDLHIEFITHIAELLVALRTEVMFACDVAVFRTNGKYR